jgi:hypothetical protein
VDNKNADFDNIAPELGWGPPSDIKSVKVINTILDIEKPDLAVLNGDLITGENTHLHNATQYLDQIVAPLVQRRITFASTYGNHDRQFNLSGEGLLEREQTKYADFSLTQSMVQNPEAGTTNYVLPVWPSRKNAQTAPRLLLWFFDSRGGMEFQKKDSNGATIQTPGFVHPSVVDWFTATNSLLQSQYGSAIPSLAFVHIPIFATAAFQTQGVDQNKAPGINDDNPLAPQAITNGKYTGQDIPFMRSLASTSGLKAVFSGHDHGDDWCFKWKGTLDGMSVTGNGMAVCFGRHSGYGGYGSWTRGARQISLREDMLKEKVESWIRLEDGTVSGWVSLNGTYGSDQYPAVNKTFTHK